MKKRIGVVLAGCGVYDGSEIHESVLTLLAIDRNGAEAVCMAPDVELDEVDHLSGQPTGRKRRVLDESARIARGNVRDVAEVSASELDAVIVPGGFGAAKNLCDFAVKGPGAAVQPDVERLLREAAELRKPIGALCIAPALIAVALGKSCAPELTVGSHAETAAAIEAAGCRHVTCSVHDCLVDRKNSIVTTPAYMMAESISEVQAGVDKVVQALLQLA